MRKAGTLQALYDPKSSAAAAMEAASAAPRKLSSQETPHVPHKFTDLAQMVGVAIGVQIGVRGISQGR